MKLASRIFQSIEKEFQLRESSCPCCRVNVRARALGLGGGLELPDSDGGKCCLA